MALSKITTASLSDNAVTTAKITDANITTAKIADTAITTAKITDANITTAKVADDAVTNAKIGAGAITNTEINASASIASSKFATIDVDKMPTPFTGLILPYGASSAPSGFLLCDGSAVSRSTYSVLFGVIGTTWGSGDGSSTFNVPDLRATFLRGSGNQTFSSKAFSGGSLGAKSKDQLHGHGHFFRTGNQFGATNTDNIAFSLMGGSTSFSSDASDLTITGSTTNQFAGGVTEPTLFIDDVRSSDDFSAPDVGNETVPFNTAVQYIIKF